MSVNTNNIYGEISITDEAIANFVYYASLECYGIVELVPYSILDSVTALFTRKNTVKGVRIRTSGDRIFIDVHVIVKHGVSIKAVAESLKEFVKYRVERFIGRLVEHRQREYKRRKTLRVRKRGLPKGRAALFPRRKINLIIT